jgi:hypothetical protein
MANIDKKVLKTKTKNHLGVANNLPETTLVKRSMQKLGLLTKFNEQNLIINTGTTSERSVEPVEGETRYNTSLSRMETYVNGAWVNISGTTLTANTGVNIASNVIKLGGTIPDSTKTTINVSEVGTAGLFICNGTTPVTTNSTAFTGQYFGTFFGDKHLLFGNCRDGLSGVGSSQATPTYGNQFSGFQFTESATNVYDVFMNHRRVGLGSGAISSIGMNDTALRLFRAGNYGNGNTQITFEEVGNQGIIKFGLANNLTGGPAIQTCMSINMEQDGTFTGDTIVKLVGLPIYTDNAAAVSAGLTVNTVYKTSTGDLRIVV